MFKVVKLKYIIISALLIAAIIIVPIISSKRTTATIKATPSLGITVVLDAGHGGVDPGSVGRKTKVTESELNLAIVLKLKDYLLTGGINCLLTRIDQNGLYGTYTKDYKKRDMDARKKIIETSNADLVVSVHMNSFTSSRYRGAQVFYSELNPESSKLAALIQQCFASDLAESNKGSSIADYFMLKCSTLPSVLCECGFISNPEDEALLVTPEYQNKVAYAIYKGIVSYLCVGSAQI